MQELAAGKGFAFTDQGEASLKGFDKPVRLYEVRWREQLGSPFERKLVPAAVG